MRDVRDIIASSSAYCPAVRAAISMRQTQSACAAQHSCRRPAAQCPLYVEFLIKTTARHLGRCR